MGGIFFSVSWRVSLLRLLAHMKGRSHYAGLDTSLRHTGKREKGRGTPNGDACSHYTQGMIHLTRYLHEEWYISHCICTRNDTSHTVSAQGMIHLTLYLHKEWYISHCICTWIWARLAIASMKSTFNQRWSTVLARMYCHSDWHIVTIIRFIVLSSGTFSWSFSSVVFSCDSASALDGKCISQCQSQWSNLKGQGSRYTYAAMAVWWEGSRSVAICITVDDLWLKI